MARPRKSTTSVDPAPRTTSRGRRAATAKESPAKNKDKTNGDDTKAKSTSRTRAKKAHSKRPVEHDDEDEVESTKKTSPSTPRKSSRSRTVKDDTSDEKETKPKKLTKAKKTPVSTNNDDEDEDDDQDKQKSTKATRKVREPKPEQDRDASNRRGRSPAKRTAAQRQENNTSQQPTKRQRSRTPIRDESEETDEDIPAPNHNQKKIITSKRKNNNKQNDESDDEVLYNVKNGITVGSPRRRTIDEFKKNQSIKNGQAQSTQLQQEQQSSQTNFGMVVFSVGFYFITSILTVLLNKYLLDGDLKKSAVFITWVQIVFTVLISYPISIISNIISPSQPPPQQQQSVQSKDTNKSPFYDRIYPLIQTLPAGIIFCLMLILNNLCLAYVHVAFYQVARSWTILMSIILSFYFFGDKASRAQLICCLVVTIGYIAACEGELPWSQLWVELQELLAKTSLYLKLYLNPTSLTPIEVSTLSTLAEAALVENAANTKGKNSILLGLIFGFFSCFMVAYNAIISKKLQRTTSLTRSQIITNINFNAAIILFVYMWLSGELQATMSNQALYQTKIILPLLIVSLSGYLLGYATQMQIQYTSPLGHNVSGTAKASVQSVIGWYLEPKPITPLTIIGTAVTIIGCGLYSIVGGPAPKPTVKDDKNKK